jgi:IS4 transposase
VRLGCKNRRDDLRQPVRLVEVACSPHRRPSGKNGRGGPEQGTVLRLVTDRMDLPAEVVGLIYQCRWQIEIFFRMFKHLLGCRHQLSYCEDGIRLQTYAAILACLLIALWTGRKPTVRTYEMLNYYFTGWADEEELDAHIAGLKEQPPQA